jgi:hypothetical protein
MGHLPLINERTVLARLGRSMPICEIDGQIAQLLGGNATDGSGNFAVALNAA